MKNKRIKILKKRISFRMVLVVLALCTSSIIFSQEKPFRIGVKIGFPNVLGGNIEYVLPLLDNKLSISLDYSSLKADSYLEEGETAKVNYFLGGLNYYFSKEGKGLYGGLSYGAFKGEGTAVDVYSNDDTKMDGVGKIDLTNNSMNVLIGAKLGGLFYFRPEIGFAFSGFPKNIDMNVTFPDGSTEIQSVVDAEDIPSIVSSGLIFNIGFGFAF